MRTDYLIKREAEHLLAALTPPNRLALRVSLATGLRISDVLEIKSAELGKRMTVKERKTAKTRRIYIPDELYMQMLGIAGKVWVFEGRSDYKKHRTRQAVWKDIKRVAKIFRLPENIAPHTMRKIFAVEAFAKSKDLKHVQRLLNHSNEGITMLYAMADVLTQRLNPPLS